MDRAQARGRRDALTSRSVVLALGFCTVMATIGLISPPTGMTVFVIQAQNPDIPAARIYRGTLAFLAADFVLVGLLIAWPGLVSWLPAVLKM